MITTLIFQTLLLLLALPLAVVDVVSTSILPAGVQDSIGMIIAMSMALDPIFPVVLLYTLVAMVISFEIWVMFYNVGMWIFDMVRHAIRG